MSTPTNIVPGHNAESRRPHIPFVNKTCVRVGLALEQQEPKDPDRDCRDPVGQDQLLPGDAGWLIRFQGF
jgi:hypothetical protein